MKKKFLTFMLAVIFLIPCIFALTGCGEEPHKHAYEHGLCDCGDYLGTTITVNEAQTGITLKAGEKSYFRYKVEAGTHYGREVNNIATSYIKYYAKYANGWEEIKDYTLIDNLSVDEYVYIEITPATNSANASLEMKTEPHSVNFVLDIAKPLGSYSTGAKLCIAIGGLEKGFRYELAISTNFAEITGIYESVSGDVVETTENEGKTIIDLTDEDSGTFSAYVHVFINSQDANTDITLTKLV